jgi:uncharacterized protein YwqG
MVKKHAITFHNASEPITELVTKFGGQPVWLTVAQWPLSRTTANPMKFVAQIALDPVIFGDIPGKMAYLFITDEDEFVEDTWLPDGGENAVIVQPGIYLGSTKPLLTGPSLYRLIDSPGAKYRVPVACEFAVELHAGADSDFVDDSVLWGEWTETERDAYHAQLEADRNKIGGTPLFLQHSEFPGEGTWQLIVQLDSASVPFEINFGDMGWGYAFLSADGTTGKFLFQC